MNNILVFILAVIACNGCSIREVEDSESQNLKNTCIIRDVIAKSDSFVVWKVNDEFIKMVGAQIIDHETSVIYSHIGLFNVSNIQVHDTITAEVLEHVKGINRYNYGIPFAPCMCGLHPEIIINIRNWQKKSLAELYLEPTHDMLIVRIGNRYYYNNGPNSHRLEASVIASLCKRINEMYDK